MNFILVLSIGLGISFVSSVLVPRGIVFVWPVSHFKEEMDVRIQSHISGFQKICSFELKAQVTCS
jgi:hypothetical protein